MGSSEKSISTRIAMVNTRPTLGNRHSIPSHTPTGDGVSYNSTSPVHVEGKDEDLHDRQRDDGVLPKEVGRRDHDRYSNCR